MKRGEVQDAQTVESGQVDATATSLRELQLDRRWAP